MGCLNSQASVSGGANKGPVLFAPFAPKLCCEQAFRNPMIFPAFAREHGANRTPTLFRRSHPFPSKEGCDCERCEQMDRGRSS